MSGGKGVRLGQENRGQDKTVLWVWSSFSDWGESREYVDWVDGGEGQGSKRQIDRSTACSDWDAR